MRTPEYLSPTSISLWQKDRQEFYLYYLADHRPPRIAQNEPMAIGAAFDAYVKSYLHERLFGKGANPLFEFNAIFETQVESQNRDWALKHGAHAFESYRKSGALSDLLLDLTNATGEPKFEMTIQGRVVHSGCVQGVPMLGKPDIWFYNRSGIIVVYDWKVNGYCSVKTTSPKKGYIKLYDAHVAKPSRNANNPHKDAQLMLVNGIYINIGHFLEEIEKGWADQTSIYSWLLGASVGSLFTVGIDQIVGQGSGTEFPYLRVASHRCRVSEKYQEELFEMIWKIWSTIKQGPRAIFADEGMDANESIARCETLDLVYRNYEQDDHPHSDWFNAMTRTHKNY